MNGAINGYLAPYSSGVVPTEWKDKYRQLEWVVVPDNADDGVMTSGCELPRQKLHAA